jgi:hypothetical protein
MLQIPAVLQLILRKDRVDTGHCALPKRLEERAAEREE